MDQWTPNNVSPLITLIGLVIVNIITAYFQGRKLSRIENSVNGHTTNLVNKVEGLQTEIKSLVAVAANEKQVAAVLASKQK